MIGGIFLTPGSILETWSPYGGQRPLERLDRYTSGPDQWGRLSPYDLGLMGYWVQGEVEEVVIVLYYPDPEAAQRDSEELEKRWRTFHQDVTISRPVETPVARYCSPMSSRVIEQADYSVLVGACPVIREDGPGPQLDPEYGPCCLSLESCHSWPWTWISCRRRRNSGGPVNWQPGKL